MEEVVLVGFRLQIPAARWDVCVPQVVVLWGSSSVLWAAAGRTGTNRRRP